jgi:valyl-tRNA synthetase
MRQLRSFEDALFKRAVVISVFLHLALYGFSIYLPSIPFLRGKRGELRYTPTVRVDLVALPDKPYREMKEMDQEIQKTEDAIREIKEKRGELTLQKKEGMKLREKIELKKEAKSAIERLKALQALEKRLRERKKEVERKGNIVTPGASLPSSGKENVLDEYRSVVVEKIKLRWALPSYLRREQQLSGEVIIFLNPEGGIIRKEIVSSGVQEFDSYMNQALEEALPFPAVPEALRREF